MAITEVIKIVDPDNGGGTHYTTLDAWEDALGGTTSGDLPTDDEIAIAQCRASSGKIDTTPVSISGWTTDATRYIKVTKHSDETNNGIFNTSNYTLQGTDVSDTLDITENFVIIDNIQVEVVETSTNSCYGITVGTGIDNKIVIKNCIVKGTCSGTGAAAGIRITGDNVICDIYNCLIYDIFASGDASFRGVWEDNGTTINMWNSTVHGCSTGIERDESTFNVVNCVLCDNTDDFNGTFTSITYCASDEHGGQGTDSGATGVDISGTWDSTCFTAPEASPPNFNVQDVDSPVYGAGTDDPGGADQDDDDIAGNPRTSTWDIGAFEYQAPVGGNAGIMTTNTGYWGATF